MGAHASLTVRELTIDDIPEGTNIDDEWAMKQQNVESINFSSAGCDRIPYCFRYFTDLRKLVFDNNRIEDYKGTVPFPSLEYLQLRNCTLFSVSGIRNVHTLRCLDVQGNSLRHLEGITSLMNLQLLNISSNKLVDLNGIGNLVKLKHLDISFNERLVILPDEIGNLKNLEYLVVSSFLKEFNFGIYELDKLTSITFHDIGGCNSCNLAINLSVNDSYDYRGLFPYLSHEMYTEILMESILNPPFELGCIPNLSIVNVIQSRVNSFTFRKKNNEWCCKDIPILDSYRIIQQQRTDYTYLFIIGEYGKLYSLPKKLIDCINLQNPMEGKIRISSFGSTCFRQAMIMRILVWIIDDEDNIYTSFEISDKVHFQKITEISSPRCIEMYNNTNDNFPMPFAVVIDNMGDSWWIRHNGSVDIVQGSLTSIRNIKILWNSFIAIDKEGKFMQGIISQPDYRFTITNQIDDLPPLQNRIHFLKSYQHHTFVVLDELGNPWVCGSNSCGKLGAGSKPVVNEFTKLSISNISQIISQHSSTLFISEDGHIYCSGHSSYPPNKSYEPVLLDITMPYPKFRKKSARK